MSPTGFFQAIGRRWFILLAFLMLTAGGAFAAVEADPVYWTRVDVVLLAPTSAENQNSLSTTNESLVDFAGIVERQLNGNQIPPRFSASTATLYGAGVRDGYKVVLKNDGAQWNNSFRQPVLTVEVVGASQAGVETRLNGVVSRIDALVQSRQTDAAVPAAAMITTLQSPSPASITRIGGSRMRSLGAISLLGVITGIATTLAVDRGMIALGVRRRRGY